MDDTLQGIAIGAALVLAWLAYQRNARGRMRAPSMLDGSTPVSTLAAAWRSWTPQQNAWAAQQAPMAPGGDGGTSALAVRGYQGTMIQ